MIHEEPKYNALLRRLGILRPCPKCEGRGYFIRDVKYFDFGQKVACLLCLGAREVTIFRRIKGWLKGW